jgi:apolipoprotein N-acyltransferase
MERAIKFMHIMIDLSLAILAALLLVLSFPDFNFGFLAWVGLVPLLVVISRKKPAYSFILSYLCGALVIAGVFLWILEVPKYTLLHHALLSLYLGLYFGVFGLAFSFIAKRRDLPTAFIAAPFLWISLEYLRGNLFFLALPWPFLSHSQYNYPIIIQFSALTGAYGVSFLIATVNCTITMVCLAIADRLGWTSPANLNFRSNRGIIFIYLKTITLTAAVLIFGQIVISTPIGGDDIKVSVAQGNISMNKKWDRNYIEEVIKTYTGLTRKASMDHPDLIVWPETAIPKSAIKDPRLFSKVQRISVETGNYILAGSANRQKFEKNGEREVKQFNSAVLITPSLKYKPKQHYNKIKLLPFGEYLPQKEIINWSYLGIPPISADTTGTEYKVFSLPNCKFAATICWENTFPNLVRQFVKNGAQFIVNITNEAWFGKSSAPYQFVSMSVFRAVENGVFVVRCANTGISCFIDPRGRIISRVRSLKGEDIFVQGVLTESITTLQSKTLYTRFGDWLIWLSFILSMAFLLISILKTRTV